MLRAINRLCERFTSRFQVRFFGHYGTSFDCSTVRLLPSVKSLAVDCLMKADNVDCLHELDNLESLSFGVFDLDKKEILDSPNFLKLRSLSLGETRSRGIDLSPIGKFGFLESLLISGHTKGIERISQLNKLQSLRLRQIGNGTRLAFVNAIEGLRELEIVLGGRSNIHEIIHPYVRKLKIIRVRGLDAFRPSSFQGLEELQIEDQIRIAEITFPGPMQNLERILLINCKTLSSLKGLDLLPSLRELRIAMTSVDVDDLLSEALPATLKTVAFYTGREKENRAIRCKLDQLGYTET